MAVNIHHSVSEGPGFILFKEVCVESSHLLVSYSCETFSSVLQTQNLPGPSDFSCYIFPESWDLVSLSFLWMSSLISSLE